MRKRLAVFLGLMSVAIFAGCLPKDWIPFWWKTYTHPIYKFSLKYPRSWEVREGGELSTQLILLAPPRDPVFRMNGNIVIEPKTEKFDLKVWGNLSVLQLGLVLDKYSLLARAPRVISNFPAEHLRGMYKANADERIVETVLFATNDFQYVVTFNFRKDTEEDYRDIIDKILLSLEAPSFLSSPR